MFEVSDGKGIKTLSSELCDTEPAFQKVCVLPHSTLGVGSGPLVVSTGSSVVGIRSGSLVISETGDSLAGDSLAGDSLAGDSLAGDSLTGDSLAGDSLTADPPQLASSLPSGQSRSPSQTQDLATHLLPLAQANSSDSQVTNRSQFLSSLPSGQSPSSSHSQVSGMQCLEVWQV